MAEVNRIDGNRLLNTSVDDLCDYFEEKYRIDVPILMRDKIIADQHETQIDVSQDPGRDIPDRSRPFLIPGTIIEISVPFSGEAEAFYIQPCASNPNPPMGEVQDGLIVLRIEGANLKADQVRNEIDRSLAEIESYLENLSANFQGLNVILFT